MVLASLWAVRVACLCAVEVMRTRRRRQVPVQRRAASFAATEGDATGRKTLETLSFFLYLCLYIFVT